MTIAAGLLCQDGIVLCADTELTLPTSKASRGKIFTAAHGSNDAAMLIACAGDYDFCKAALQYMEPALLTDAAPTVEDLQSAIESAIEDVYEHHIYPNKLSSRHIELIGAMWGRVGGYRLVKTADTAVIRVDRYEVAGTGGELGEYILKRMYRDGMRLSEAVALAIYILNEVKQRGMGCGGESQVSVLRSDGAMFEVSRKQVAEVEQSIDQMEKYQRLIFAVTFDLDRSEENLQDAITHAAKGLRMLRGPMATIEALRRANPGKSDEELAPLLKAQVRRVLQRSKRAVKALPPSPGSPEGSDGS